MGGLVAKEFLVNNAPLLTEQRIEIGLFLVASPSLGSKIANIPLVRLFISAFGNKFAEGLRFSPKNLQLQQLDRSFMDLRDSGRLPIAGKELFEDRGFWFFGQIVEPFSAARYFADAVRIPRSTHSSIAKPESPSAPAPQHQYLRDFIHNYRYTSAHTRVRKVTLRIFLGSESPETVSEMLATCRNVLNSVLRQPRVEIPYDLNIVKEPDYAKAFAELDSNLDNYDIITLDDLWLSRFEPHLADLSALESFQDCFSRNSFDSVFLKSLTPVCKRPNSDVVFAVPLSGNVQLLMYRQDLLRESISTQKLPRDPDELLAHKRAVTSRLSDVSEI